MTLTLITHVYNEHLLLPFWLEHHLPLADHGVVIDYASTDGTPDLVRQLAPHWELRQSRNPEFDAMACDAEVMAIEQEHDGWKLALNVTEFVLSTDLRAVCEKYARLGQIAFAMQSVIGVDLPEERPKTLDPMLPFWRQVEHGYLDEPPTARRLRYCHRAADGRYEVGRHGIGWPWVRDDTLILWAGFTHMDLLKPRKLQIQTRMSAYDKSVRHGFQHLTDDAGLERTWAEQAARAYSLEQIPAYRAFGAALAPV